jgi:hypothetical protein
MGGRYTANGRVLIPRTIDTLNDIATVSVGDDVRQAKARRLR